jgi:glutamate dehydrogenase
MAMRAPDAAHGVVERAAELALERLDGDHAKLIADLVRRYWARVAPDDLLARDPADLFGAALAHWHLGAVRRPDDPPGLRLYNPDLEVDGWESRHTAVELVCEDRPFLVDSVTMALQRHGWGIHLVVHPVLDVERTTAGDLVGLGGGGARESWIHLEVDRQAQPGSAVEVRQDLLEVLDDVRLAVDDWPAMRSHALALADELATSPPTVPQGERLAARELLSWMADDHFTFLGYREYELATVDGHEVLRGLPGTGLGLLRDEKRPPSTLVVADLPEPVKARLHQPTVLLVTKAHARSTVHRPDHLEYVGIKVFDATGKVTGERRFLGHYTALAYRASATDIPFLRQKIDAVIERSGLRPDSHDGRELWNVLETFPRDDLFQISVDELFEIAIGIVNLQERKQVRLFTRRDYYGRFVSCLVFVPRDRYSGAVAAKMEQVLLTAFGGTSVEHTTLITESVLARVHFLVTTPPGAPMAIDLGDVERRLAAVSRWWIDDLRDALVVAEGEHEGLGLLARFGEAFPASYREEYGPKAAVNDIRRLAALGAGGFTTALYRPVEAGPGELRLKLYTEGQAVSLSAVLPLLEHLGMQVTDEHPYELRLPDGTHHWLYDFGLRAQGSAALDSEDVRDELRATFAGLWKGTIEGDGFNRLVLLAGLTGRQVTVLRAYAKYQRQAGTTFSQRYIETTLAAHPAIARKLIELFALRFDPGLADRSSVEVLDLADELRHDLDAVASLDEDRILRAFLHLIEATVRTNAYRSDGVGEPRPWLSFKLDPSKVPDLPLPRPMFEIWVYSPHVEGVHLRGGRVARGGLRWSDRMEDFRTEVLGLMKAQMVKNAVIVPIGAKGGFVVKQPPADRASLQAEVRQCYSTFLRGLLDLTDNIVAGVVVPPPQVVRHDGDDPYLVVAADKGTATFSDLANSLAAEYGFWLGDAFASGGSDGYDHKRMGITAKGAWESVRRHFLVLGVDADHAPITVAGIGDMSGDVFGNGMLLSRAMKLVAAFDHRHVFLDPDPDPAASWEERRRLFELPGSSWDDYDRSLISTGGGVWSRSAKSVALSAEVREVLGTGAVTLTPTELVSAILKAPVDLLWNGGIGTYVKASTETNASVGDRANDNLRVDGVDLRTRVVAEGGNLGFTQLGRVEFARNGGLINTDAIDNSAGVDCSDHEVNIKILLDSVVAAGDLTTKQRNELLAEMTEDVADHVLRDNDAQNVALAIARAQAAPMVDVHARYLRSLEHEGLIDRDLEFLPTEKVLREREASGAGLTTPEFAVVLAYTKTTNVAEVLGCELPEDPYLVPELIGYFPPALQERFADRMPHHRLRREIVATVLVNDMVNKAGTSFDHRMLEETGAPVPDAARAHVAARDVFGMRALWDEIGALDTVVPSDVQLRLWLNLRQLVERGVLWLLRHRRPPLEIGPTVTAFHDGVTGLMASLPSIVVGSRAEEVAGRRAAFVDAGVPLELAHPASGWPLLHTAFDIIEVAHARGRPVEEAAAAYWHLFEDLDLNWLWDRIGLLPRADRWQTHARAGLRDDLLAAMRELLDEVLRGGDLFSGVDDLVKDWIVFNDRAVERVARAFGEIRSGGTFDLTTLSVAQRQLRNLVLTSSPCR